MVNFSKLDLAPALYFVATPIGAARDVTLRALDLLASADMLVAEDTRSLRHLMQIHGVPLEGRRIRAYHDHSGEAVRREVVAAIQAGGSVVYAPEAGTAMISDPGYGLARAVIEAGAEVYSAPGPSAALSAVTVAGFAERRILFCGFAPSKGASRTAFLSEIIDVRASAVLYEAPGRVRRLLQDLSDAGQGARRIALCRELTKRFEEVLRGTVSELLEALGEHPPKGECVLVLEPPPEAPAADEQTITEALNAAMARLSVKDAVAEVAQSFDLPRREVYQKALALQKADGQ